MEVHDYFTQALQASFLRRALTCFPNDGDGKKLIANRQANFLARLFDGTAGNIDWTSSDYKTCLTFAGPPGRHTIYNASWWAAGIYKNGALYTTAPGPVVGCGILGRWLIAIYQTTLDSKLMAISAAPLSDLTGWTEIATFIVQSKLLTPIFVAPDGTKAIGIDWNYEDWTGAGTRPQTVTATFTDNGPAAAPDAAVGAEFFPAASANTNQGLVKSTLDDDTRLVDSNYPVLGFYTDHQDGSVHSGTMSWEVVKACDDDDNVLSAEGSASLNEAWSGQAAIMTTLNTTVNLDFSAVVQYTGSNSQNFTVTGNPNDFSEVYSAGVTVTFPWGDEETHSVSWSHFGTNDSGSLIYSLTDRVWAWYTDIDGTYNGAMTEVEITTSDSYTMAGDTITYTVTERRYSMAGGTLTLENTVNDTVTGTVPAVNFPLYSWTGGTGADAYPNDGGDPLPCGTSSDSIAYDVNVPLIETSDWSGASSWGYFNNLNDLVYDVIGDIAPPWVDALDFYEPRGHDDYSFIIHTEQTENKGSGYTQSTPQPIAQEYGFDGELKQFNATFAFPFSGGASNRATNVYQEIRLYRDGADVKYLESTTTSIYGIGSDLTSTLTVKDEGGTTVLNDSMNGTNAAGTARAIVREWNYTTSAWTDISDTGVVATDANGTPIPDIGFLFIDPRRHVLFYTYSADVGEPVTARAFFDSVQAHDDEEGTITRDQDFRALVVLNAFVGSAWATPIQRDASYPDLSGAVLHMNFGSGGVVYTLVGAAIGGNKAWLMSPDTSYNVLPILELGAIPTLDPVGVI